MTVIELRDLLQSLTVDDLGKTRSGKPAIAICPPDFENGVVDGIAIAIQRVPTGKKIPSRFSPSGDQLIQFHRMWTVKVVNYSNSSKSSESLEKIKNKIQHHFLSQVDGNDVRYFEPTPLNKEQFSLKIYDPELIIAN